MPFLMALFVKTFPLRGFRVLPLLIGGSVVLTIRDSVKTIGAA